MMSSTKCPMPIYLQLTMYDFISTSSFSQKLPMPMALQYYRTSYRMAPGDRAPQFKWPRQPMPPPEAWRHWRWAIQTMYLRIDSDRLTTPLKEWTDNVNKDWTWEWRINPATLELYQRSGEQWFSRRPAINRRTYIAYDIHRQRRVTIDPNMMAPATPSFDTSQTYIIVQLPITTIKPSAPASQQGSTDLLDRVCTPPTQWAAPLWHRIRPKAPVDALLHHVQRQNTLILSSDASVDAAKHSCCACVEIRKESGQKVSCSMADARWRMQRYYIARSLDR